MVSEKTDNLGSCAVEVNVKDWNASHPTVGRLLERENTKNPSKYFGYSEVTDSLLLCSASALRPGFLDDLAVDCVVNAASELPDTPLPPKVSYLRANIDDIPSADLLPHLDSVADTIQEVKQKGGRTLVHCVAGISRSAALCLGFLMKYEGMTLKKAFSHLKARRPCIRPNTGFFAQLIEFERRLFNVQSVNMVASPATKSLIPDVYEPDYQNMLRYQRSKKFSRQ